MRWYQIKKAALDAEGSAVLNGLKTETDPDKVAAWSRKARILYPQHPELVLPLVDVIVNTTYDTVRKEAILSIGSLAGIAGPAASNAMDALVNVITGRVKSSLIVKIDSVWALGKFGEQAAPYVPSLRAAAASSTIDQFKEVVNNTVDAIEQGPELADTPVVTENIKLNGAFFKHLKSRLVPGAKVKLRFLNTSTDNITFGTLTRVDFKDRHDKINGKDAVLKIPQYVIGLKSGQEVTINPLAPEAEIWLYKDPEDIPLAQYKGIWIKTNDPMAKKIGEVNDDGTVTGMRVAQSGETITLKIMKGDVPWTVNVPLSSCKPTMKAPVWGVPYAKNRSALGYGDVVSFDGDPSQQYVVEEIDGGTAKIRPVRARKGSGSVETDISQIKYLGRFEYGKGLVSDPHFTSPALKAKPPAPRVPDPE